MDSTKFISSIFLFIFSISYGYVYENKPVIAVTQGVIGNDDILPIYIYWYHPNLTIGDTLKVYLSHNQPKDSVDLPILSFSGYYELSPATMERGNSPDAYCVVIESREGTLDNNPSCESRIQWMYDRRDILRSFSLGKLVIPGTHQSAGYLIPNNETLNYLDLASRWILCQTKSIKSQLMDGIRYLDLRPGRVEIDGRMEYVIDHHGMNQFLMKDVVTEINEFMDSSKDIVIVSFKKFSEEFRSEKDHRDFINYLEFSFGAHPHPRRNWTQTLKEFWAVDKRLILSYSHPVYTASLYTWPPIPNHWVDAQTLSQLHAHLDKLHRNHNDFRPYAAPVVFKHSGRIIPQDAHSKAMSPQQQAERLSKYIAPWYTEEWHSSANIIVVDFYQTSGIVDIAIQLNEKRAENPHFYQETSKP